MKLFFDACSDLNSNKVFDLTLGTNNATQLGAIFYIGLLTLVIP
jgi:hypothetical protein